jgi:hypothetical protein
MPNWGPNLGDFMPPFGLLYLFCSSSERLNRFSENIKTWADNQLPGRQIFAADISIILFF